LPRSRRCATALGGAEVPCLRDDTIAPRAIQEQPTKLERAARRGRPSRRTSGELAVARQHDPPSLPDAVLVDLELGLETAVVRVELQLRGAGTSAGPGHAYLVSIPRLRRRRQAQTNRCKRDQQERADDLHDRPFVRRLEPRYAAFRKRRAKAHSRLFKQLVRAS
jgi:hypothetical protein